MKSKPLIPLLDYLRIHSVIRSVLDSVDAHTPHACIFFSVAGAAILQEFYKKDARPVAGAAFLLLDEQQRNAMSFATLAHGQVQSTDTSFHALVLCDGYAIDFMAPLFPETCKAAGHPFIAQRRMFQKRWADMAPSHEHLDRAGDFHFVPNPELTADLLQSFFKKPASGDLVNVCLHWFSKPPKSILPELNMQNDLGEITRIRLQNSVVSGVW
ncbi:DUF2026 family protein [Acidovorax sp. SUPP950]|uniref:DUF2026 family protein n=1 Tax=Acidovorax sp. SUPP950 TaxID=511901 RepID=UPI0023BDFD63|nr:DUF2026 family protein [Acidovorax sp. SUPP950]GKS73255.1 DUF2026 family protein [Acidovorax sp. SUPP950]